MRREVKRATAVAETKESVKDTSITLQQNIAQLSDTKKMVEGKIGVVEKELDLKVSMKGDLSTKIASLTTSKIVLEGDIAVLQVKLKAEQQLLASVSKDVQGVLAKKASVAEDMASIQAENDKKVADRAIKVQELENNHSKVIVNLQAELGALQAGIKIASESLFAKEGIVNDVAKLNTEKSNLVRDNAVLNEKTKALQHVNKNLNDQNANLSKEYVVIQARYREIEVNVASEQARLDAITASSSERVRICALAEDKVQNKIDYLGRLVEKAKTDKLITDFSIK